jgi:hypothetical protein
VLGQRRTRLAHKRTASLPRPSRVRALVTDSPLPPSSPPLPPSSPPLPPSSPPLPPSSLRAALRRRWAARQAAVAAAAAAGGPAVKPVDILDRILEAIEVCVVP